MDRVSWRDALAWARVFVLFAISVWFLLLPVATIVGELRDPAWRRGEIAPTVERWHASLTERLEPWARERVADARGVPFEAGSLSGNEWPGFTCLLYLWATEALQQQWRDGPRDAPSPAERSADAIGAAAALIVDPAHAGWVRAQWGDGYLDANNLFYRFLLVAGIDSYERLTGDPRYRATLDRQSAALAAELDASPHGVVGDYPGESYSVDVLLAYAAVARARARLGDRDAAWIERARRAFTGGYVDDDTGLPGYAVDANDGTTFDSARGVGLAAMLIFTHELWPDTADDWYARFVAQFWQQRLGFVGLREFPYARDWALDIDSGPVVAGYGIATNGFGVGALRVAGDLDRAYPLTATALLAAWPLPNDTLLGPRIVSNVVDSPYTGEAALLFALTRTPRKTAADATTAVPPGVWLTLALVAFIGIASPLHALRKRLRASRAADAGARARPSRGSMA